LGNISEMTILCRVGRKTLTQSSMKCAWRTEENSAQCLQPGKIICWSHPFRGSLA